MRHTPIPALSDYEVAAFWALVDQRTPDECWHWNGPRFPIAIGKQKRTPRGGYPRFYVKRDGKVLSLRAHRVALFLTSGKDPGDLLACHTCDNVICCNGLHLFPGTDQENMADCVAKGRQAKGDEQAYRKYPECRPMGERNHFAKVTEQCISIIREEAKREIACGRAEKGRRLPRGLVARIKTKHPEIELCNAHVARIIRGQAWSHMKEEAYGGKA